MSEQLKISNKARQHVRELLVEYKTIQRDIDDLRESIMNPHIETDENQGGGRSSFSVFESDKVIKIVSHEQIQFRSKAIKVIESVLSKSTDNAQMIIELKYFREEPLSWVAISQYDGVNYEEDNCRKIERKLVDEIAKKLGW